MPGFGKSTFTKKRRVKRFGSKCHKCAMLSCEAYCKNLGMVSNNSENKAKFIKDGLSKESLDDILQS